MKAKLTRALVQQARARAAQGEPLRLITADMPVALSVVARAIRGDTWASVPGALPRYRMARGEAHPRAVLTDDLVLQLRARWDEGRGASMTQMAREHGLARQTVSRAVQGFSWKHLGRATA